MDVPDSNYSQALASQTAQTTLGRCRFCEQLNEITPGEIAPMCVNCNLDLSVPSHLRPLQIEGVGGLLWHLTKGQKHTVDRSATASVPEPVPVVTPPPAPMDVAATFDSDVIIAEEVSDSGGVIDADVVDETEATIHVMAHLFRDNDDNSDSDIGEETIVVSRPEWVIELPDGDTIRLGNDIIVGRKPDAGGDIETVAIPDATRTLSRSHAHLWRDDATWMVEDLGSANGVTVFDDAGTETQATPGVAISVPTERLRLGTLDLTLRRVA